MIGITETNIKGVSLVVPYAADPVPVDVMFGYADSDPYSVFMAVRVQGDDGFIEWEFARELLIEALNSGEAGEGAVVLARSKSHVAIALRSEGGSALLYGVTVDRMRRFIRATEKIVARGDESDRYDWDEITEQLLEWEEEA